MTMTVFLTPEQLAIVHRAGWYFGNVLANQEVRSKFRQEGENMSVGLAYSEDGQHFIVRTVVPPTADDNAIDLACMALFSHLRASYSNVMGLPARWAA
jgi:uncharacterized protein YkuJ